MSEFRQYRLASQLLNQFDCLKDPKSYTNYLFNSEKQRAGIEKIESRILQLAQKSSDPVNFLARAKFFKDSSPELLDSLISFFESFQGHSVEKRNIKPIVFQATQRPSPLESMNKPALKPQEDFINDDLDEIAKKLEKVSYQLGKPSSSIKPVPLESEDETTDFVSFKAVRLDIIDSLGRFPVAVQELCVIEDILFLLMNLEGKYFSINPSHQNIIFHDESIDSSILNRIKPILRVSYCANKILEFISNRTSMKHGQVSQAFAFSIDHIMKEYYQVVMSLDRKFKERNLGLHQLCFHLTPFVRNIQALLHLTFEVERQNSSGGALIRLLEDKISMISGDRQLKQLYGTILAKSSRPFINLLIQWLRTGDFVDMNTEFMITKLKKSESSNVYEEDFLHSRFEIYEKNSPRLLEDLKKKILLTGIYRNIQNFLKITDEANPIERLEWDRKSISESINNAFMEVNKSIMSNLFQTSKLLDTMASAKRFYFVENVDYIDNFLSTMNAELFKSAKDISLYQIQSAFDLALKNSSVANDNNLTAFNCEFANSGLYDMLVKVIQSAGNSNESVPSQKTPKGFEVFNINMKVGFPESLIMNTKALTKYQIIFRHIFHCADLIRGLSTPLSKYPASGPQLRQFQFMKQSMLQFVRTVHYYVTYNVLEPQWARFFGCLKERKFSSVEEVIDTHMDFLDTCLRECMLTNSKLVQLIGMIWSTCSKFQALIHEINNRIESKNLTDSVFNEVLAKFSALHQHFLKYVRVLIEALQYYAARDCDHYLANFLSNLDCQFYSMN